ncbi:nitrate/nitrite two-component system sensor histidine kinase NarX [Leminorella grimontii]|uniref:nitrate/nitrite two-component system sensor histidine kinase NarX n=1 Tax=Leminorella grimontii TaxID=82981 RepID=UPI0032201682
MKHFCARFSIISQVVILMLLIGTLGVVGMSVSGWIAQSIQGNAHAINTSGSLRMQSYRLLSMTPLAESDQRYFDELEKSLNSPVLRHTVKQEGLEPRYDRLRHYWQTQLRPALTQAKSPRQAAEDVAGFVRHLDELVSSIDQQTEKRLAQAALVQKVCITLTLLLLLTTIWYLRSRLLHPWRRLLAMAKAIGQGDFSQRFPQGNHQDEMATLGGALNAMSTELSHTYGQLEMRVAEKTEDLQHKNQVLSYLYRASRQLHSNAPLCSRLMSVLGELQALTPLRALQIQLYENSGEERLNEFCGDQSERPAACPAPNCFACLEDTIGANAHQEAPDGETLSWSLKDRDGRYGLMLGRLPHGAALTDGQRQLVNTLAEQLAGALALELQSEQKQQLAVMEERSAIARELHDSIAQSLSCLKMQISYLQMQYPDLPEGQQKILKEMREELNTAYRQLRELLTTFRLRLTEPGLLPALQVTIEEFNQRLGFAIDFDYRLPARRVSSLQAIHLVQIAREALSNVLKHAEASQVSISVGQTGDGIELSIRDNGKGIGQSQTQRSHYGLIIMADRARSLNGEFSLLPLPEGGTEVRIVFPPEALWSPATS